MILEPICEKTKSGKEVIFRSAIEEDAAICKDYLCEVCAESDNLLREPEEIDRISLEKEKNFILAYRDNPHRLLLQAFVDGEYAGNCSFDFVNPANRLRHRADFGIALYERFCNEGIGSRMIEIASEKAKEAGYEILELEVFAKNERAIHTYMKNGFVPYGRLKDGVRYADGTYTDLVYMAKTL